jgi:protein-S-isoprenylcysteine O-methyltransferase Ste14
MLVAKGLVRGLFQLALFATFLLVPAAFVPGGTWYWPRALVFLGVYGVILAASTVVLALVAPASLEARLKAPGSKKQPVADRIITAVLVLTALGWFASIPVDVFYLKLLPKPQFVISVFGGALFLLGFAIVLAAIYQNSFAVPIVEDQTERGQTLVDTGLYGVVRHPLYLGMLPFLAGIALWLESYASLIAVSVLLSVLVARIIVEEKVLRKTLPGYVEYMRKVRYRLVPFVW